MLKLIINLLGCISVDCLVGFSLFLLWKYLDRKYFSTSEIELLKQENEIHQSKLIISFNIKITFHKYD